MVCSLIQSSSTSEQVVHAVASCTCHLKETAVKIKQVDQVIPDLRSCLLLQDHQDSVSSLLSQDDDFDTASSISSQDSAELEYRVSWAAEIVQEVRYRPRTHFADVRDLHYTKADYAQFRQEYKNTLIRNRLEEKRIKREQERKMRENQETPISWLVNLVHNHFVSEGESSTKQTTIGKQIQSHKPKEVHIELLVDTLYIF